MAGKQANLFGYGPAKGVNGLGTHRMLLRLRLACNPLTKLFWIKMYSQT